MDSRLQSIQNDLMNIQEASNWATDYLGKNVTPSNISYLIQYGKIRKIGENGFTQVSKNELLSYYRSFNGTRENNWKERLGDDLKGHYRSIISKRQRQQNMYTGFIRIRGSLFLSWSSIFWIIIRIGLKQKLFFKRRYYSRSICRKWNDPC